MRLVGIVSDASEQSELVIEQSHLADWARDHGHEVVRFMPMIPKLWVLDQLDVEWEGIIVRRAEDLFPKAARGELIDHLEAHGKRLLLAYEGALI